MRHATSFLVTLFLSLAGPIGFVRPSENTSPEAFAPKYKVRVEQNVRIPMRDGKTLSADLIRPDEGGRFPAIIEYIPYRKDDLTLSFNEVHYYFAERGFVGVRLDVRGTGGSDGINTDEYVPQEQEDGFDAVEWCAKQPWCNGNVGMTGTSYGGFTCIQVAMHQPPHLKAIVPIYATDDRYTDDCHYSRGGNMRMYYDVGTYGGRMVAMNALPPIPELAGPGWAKLWQQRLEQNEPYIPVWMKHQVDGPYWRGASLRPNYERVQCPTFLIAGWRDGYSNPMLRTYQHLKAPKKLLMGPWVHMRPHISVPGPRINHLHEMLRFFAHWLRNEDTGIMKEPSFAVYMQEYVRPERTLDISPGQWRNEAGFPAAGTKELVFHLQEGSQLAAQPGPVPQRAFDEYEYLPTVGTANGYWSGGGVSFYLAGDQRADEAYSLVYNTVPLKEEVRILGWPRVILHASSSARVATFVAKLADVAPGGYSCLIVDGSLNATRRKSLTDPSPLTPGEVYELDVPMSPIGWVLKPGHRLRLAVSSSDFPNLWPTPEHATNRVYRSGSYASRVILPVVPESKLEPPRFLPPAQMRQIHTTYLTAPRQEIHHDQITGTSTVAHDVVSTIVLPGNRGSLERRQSFRCSASAKDPAQASVSGTHTFVLRREDGVFEITAESTIRATATAFHVTIDLNVLHNGKPFFQKKWMVSEPRRLL